MKTNYKIANFLIALRKEKNLTQSDLSDTLCVTPQAISKWESGKSLPEINQLIALANLYNVTVDEILSGERAGDSAESKSKILISTFSDQRRFSYASIISALSISIPALLLFFTYIAGYAWGFMTLASFIIMSTLNVLFIVVFYCLLYFPEEKLPKHKLFQKLRYSKTADIVRVAFATLILLFYFGLLLNLVPTFIMNAIEKFA